MEWGLRGLIAAGLLVVFLYPAGLFALFSWLAFSGCSLDAGCKGIDVSPIWGAFCAGAALLLLGTGVYGAARSLRGSRPHPRNVRALGLLTAGIVGGYAVFRLVAAGGESGGCPAGSADYGYPYCSPPPAAFWVASLLGLFTLGAAIYGSLRICVFRSVSGPAQPSKEASA